MNPKQLKFYRLFAQMSKENPLDANVLTQSFQRLLELDYAMAAEVWDYLCTEYEPQSADKKTAALLGQTVFGLFYAKAPAKCVKTVYEVPAVRRAVFQYNPDACAKDGFGFAVTVDAMAGNKIVEAEEILKCLIKNPHVAFGRTLQLLIERLYVEILKKNGGKKIEMSKKLSGLLLAYIAKIKTDERAMLEQRVRETL